MVLVVAMGVIWALQGQTGKALCCYVILPYMVVFNPMIIDITLPMVASARFGILLIGIGMMVSASKRVGVVSLPLGSLFAYLLVVTMSSITGYCANVSFLKLVNFGVFIIGLSFGTRNLDQKPEELQIVRAFLMAMACFLIFGSLLLLPFPAYAYMTSATYMINQYGVEVASDMLRDKGLDEALFGGLTCHSQALAPIVSMIVVYVLADMLIMVKRATKFHIVMLISCLMCSFMTRSRTGLFSLFVGGLAIVITVSKSFSVSRAEKVRVRGLLSTMVTIAILAVIVMEVKNQSITRWLRKNDTEESGATLGEAIVSTRLSTIEELTNDFKKNPLWGMGFQVNSDSSRFKGQGFVLSAPVEKGLLPFVIAGEGGCLGIITFIIFLFAFFTNTVRRRMYMTTCMFIAFLATNIGEATFFSPGGIGGILWVYGTVGGLILDAYCIGISRVNANYASWENFYEY